MPPFLGAFFSGVVRGALKTHLPSPRLFVTAHTQKGPPLAERPLRTVVGQLVKLRATQRVPRQPALPADCQAAAGCQPSPQLERMFTLSGHALPGAKWLLVQGLFAVTAGSGA